MRKNVLKKVTASVLALTMVVGMTGVVSAAHAANGANVASSAKWSSFSVCDGHSTGVTTEWEEALQGVEVKDEDGTVIRNQTYLIDYATEGWITKGATASSFDYWVKNSGWDGEYNPYTGDLIGDNPWGLTASTASIPVEMGRYYTISFKIMSTLEGKKTVKDDDGNALKDDDGNEVTEAIKTKHIEFKAYDPTSPGEPGIKFVDVDGATTNGMIELNKDEWKTVTAQIQIPATKQTGGTNTMGAMFALGAHMNTYPDEIAMSGYVYVKDFKVTAGTQYTVKLTNGKTTKTQYVNKGERATSVVLPKKGYTQTGYKTSSGATYNFNSAVNSNLTLTAVYKKTAKPKKPTITVKSKAKKKATVTIKKVTGANGYQVQYSAKKNMKSSKTKTTTKTTYTIKKLKSKKITYVRVRAYTLDSASNEVYGTWCKKKAVYVK